MQMQLLAHLSLVSWITILMYTVIIMTMNMEMWSINVVAMAAAKAIVEADIAVINSNHYQ